LNPHHKTAIKPPEYGIEGVMEEKNQEFLVFRKALGQALTHLFDPGYNVPETLHFLIPGAADSTNALRSLLMEEIEALKPASDTDLNSRTQRSYDILTLRYIEGLSQESAAEQLQMSLRTLQRSQRQAVLILAYRLWSSRRDTSPENKPVSTQLWRSQLDQEITLLSQSAAQTDIKTLFNAVDRITTARSSKRYDLRISLAREQLVCPIHSSVLQQMILSLLDSVMERAPSETMQLKGQRITQQTIQIKVIGGHPSSSEPLDLTLVEGFLASQQDCKLEIMAESPLTVALEVPLVQVGEQQRTILFVDDNTDLAVLFTSYCAGTPYELVHVNQGAAAQQRIREVRPDIIILDVMLPDVDGWELLISLKADPAKATIPVIVCSVVTDPELALDLGASLYLQKPVWRDQFLEAVEKILME
jgi:CheY-like chemotaxis protein